MSYLDTRDLETEREDLKQQVLESFLENFPQYEDMTYNFEDIRFEEEEIESWKEDWFTELEVIEAINDLEDELTEWRYGVTLIEEADFEDYCQEFVEDCGYISKDMPQLIKNNIDWSGIAEDMKQDYTEVEFRGETYLFN
jgi:Antirestriction protein (ArdA)